LTGFAKFSDAMPRPRVRGELLPGESVKQEFRMRDLPQDIEGIRSTYAQPHALRLLGRCSSLITQLHQCDYNRVPEVG